MMKSPVYNKTPLLLAGLLLAPSLPGMVLAQLTDPSDSITGQRGAMQIYKYDARSSALAAANSAASLEVSPSNPHPRATRFACYPNTLPVTMHPAWRHNNII